MDHSRYSGFTSSYPGSSNTTTTLFPDTHDYTHQDMDRFARFQGHSGRSPASSDMTQRFALPQDQAQEFYSNMADSPRDAAIYSSLQVPWTSGVGYEYSMYSPYASDVDMSEMVDTGCLPEIYDVSATAPGLPVSDYQFQTSREMHAHARIDQCQPQTAGFVSSVPEHRATSGYQGFSTSTSQDHYAYHCRPMLDIARDGSFQSDGQFAISGDNGFQDHSTEAERPRRLSYGMSPRHVPILPATHQSRNSFPSSHTHSSAGPRLVPKPPVEREDRATLPPSPAQSRSSNDYSVRAAGEDKRRDSTQGAVLSAALNEDAEGRMRTHRHYTARPQADGHYHCPYLRHGECRHKPTKLKCNYESVSSIKPKSFLLIPIPSSPLPAAHTDLSKQQIHRLPHQTLSMPLQDLLRRPQLQQHSLSSATRARSSRSPWSRHPSIPMYICWMRPLRRRQRVSSPLQFARPHEESARLRPQTSTE